ncbi:MAG: FkbM family methyltransferase [Deltaproteobacteria bacterium]|nr:FkbM family methyltransferase [Deltaproteobacteria bacterium]
MGVLDTIRYIVRHPLAGKHPVRSLVDWARWQLGSRLVPGPIVVPFVDATQLVVARGNSAALGNVYCGLHEPEDMAFVLHFLTADDLFADVGANVGSYTVLAAGAVGARAHAFEPVPITFRALETNVRHNRLEGRVTLHRTGVGAEAAELVMTSDADAGNRILRPGESAPDTVRVQVRRLDDLLAGEVPALVKIDVEGFEQEVLAGAPATLASPALRAIIIEVWTRHDEVARALAERGFTAIDYDPLTRTASARGAVQRARPNTIFVRDVAEAQARVRAARRFQIKSVEI